LPGPTILSATERPSTTSRARYTLAMPPRPSSRRTWYRPMVSPRAASRCSFGDDGVEAVGDTERVAALRSSGGDGASAVDDTERVTSLASLDDRPLAFRVPVNITYPCPDTRGDLVISQAPGAKRADPGEQPLAGLSCWGARTRGLVRHRPVRRIQ